MSFVLLTGGARSGKSAAATRLASRTEAPVTFVATAVAGDDDMAGRIAAHRADRPPGWTTIEEPLDAVDSVSSIAPTATSILDCVTFWVFNLVESGLDDEAVLAEAARLGRCCSERDGLSIVVTNEVGSGVVPATTLGVRYRDLLGAVNARLASNADRCILMVAGRATELLPIERML
jgi:adenosyl cobinamide kinase/adenosyl cobinamide phosphate guanylyltransferase